MKKNNQKNKDKRKKRKRKNIKKDKSKEEIEGMKGNERVVVSRYLQKLKKEDIVIARRGSLEIKDLHALVEKIEHHVSLNTKHST